MKNKKMEKISRKQELENKKQKLKKASVVDEIIVDIPVEEETNNTEKRKKKNKIETRNEYHYISNEDIQDENNYGEETMDNPKKKKKKKNKFIVLKVILVILISVMVYLGYKFIRGMNQNGWTIGGFVATMLGHDSNTLARLSRTNILLVGQSQNLTDTLLICSYDPKTQEAALLSIPRDTFVGRSRNHASAYDKINAVYQTNPDLLVEKVRDLTGLDINYYIKVDTHGLRDLVDSIGGIYFDVPIDMDYDDPGQDLYIHMKKGYQLLDGDKAEQVLRFRHNNNGTTYPADYGEQDLGRMRTQRAFLSEVFKQMVKPESITKIDDYIKIVNNNVETNFSIWDLKDYAPYLLNYKIENLETATLPGVPEKINNLWFYSANKKQTQELVKELFKTELSTEQKANSEIKVKIINGTSDEKNLTNVQNLLKENGYKIESTGTTTLTKTTTIINRTNQDEKIANKLQETIGVGIIAKSSKGDDSSVDFTVIIGDDYN